MKNKTVNKKVLRAMSIGLAAMMTVQPVLATPVFAEDATSEDNNNTTSYDEENHESQAANDAREAVDNAATSTTVVASDVNAVKTDIPVIDEKTGEVLNSASLIPGALGNVSDTLKVVDADLTVIENYQSNENKITGSGYDEAYNANVQAYLAAVAVYGTEGPEQPADDADEATKKAYEDFQALKTEIERQLSKPDTEWNKANILKPAIEGVTADDFVDETEANANLETAVTEGNASVAGAKEEQAKANTAGTEASELIADTEEKYNEYVESIRNASTISDANASYDALVEMITAAGETLDEKQAAYDAALAAYNEYQAKYSEQKAAIEKAEADYNNAKAIYEDAVKAYDDKAADHEQKVKDLTIYHETLADAEAKYNSAKEALDAIQVNADALAELANKAKTEVLAKNAEALDIVANIDIAAEKPSNSTDYWKAMDVAFESIMRNYYFKTQGIPSDAKMEWNHNRGKAYKTADRSYDGNSYNYCIVTYTDEDGNKVTKYYNYVLEDGSKNSIVIFEKRDTEVKANQALYKDKNSLLYTDGVDVDYYTVGNRKYTQDELNKALEDKSIVEINGVYFKQNAATETIDNVKYDSLSGVVSDENDGSYRTVIKIGGDVTVGEFKKDDDGDVIREFTADQTTVKYHKATLTDKDGNGHYLYTSGEGAKNAYDMAIAGLGDGDEIISNATESLKEETHEEEYSATETVTVDKYQASGEYVDSFAKTIDLTSTVYYGEGAITGWIFGDEEEAKKAAEDNINNDFNKYSAGNIVDDMYILESTLGDVTHDTDSFIVKGAFAASVKSSAVCSITYATVEKSNNLLENKKEWEDVLKPYGYKAGGKDKAFVEAFDNYLKSEEVKSKYLYVKANVGKKLFGQITSYTLSFVEKQTISGDVITAAGAIGDEAVASANNTAIAGANDSLNAKLNGKFKVGGNGAAEKVGDDSADVTVTKTKKVTTYGYEISYWAKDGSTTSNVTVKTEKYGKAETVKGAVNRNVYDENAFVESKDENFKKLVQGARDTKAKYEKLVADANKAQADVIAAQNAVNELADKIDTIKKNKNVKDVHWLKPLVLLNGISFNPNELTLDELEEFLATAEAQLADAKARLEALNESLEDVEAERDARIDALTPTPATGGETTPASGTTPFTPTYVTPAAAPAFALPAGIPGAPAAGVAGARTSRVAVADGAEDTGVDAAGTAVKPAEDKENPLAISEDTIKTIKDEATPLSTLADETTNKKMNWWWLLLIAALGATGEEMYRRNKKKKEEKAALEAEINKNN